MKNKILIPLLFLSACGVVEDNEVCFEKRLGKYSDSVLATGINGYNPFTTDMICIDAKTQKFEEETETYTKDMQTAKIKYFVNWSVYREKAMDLHKKLGSRYRDRLESETESAIKSIVGQSDSSNLISSRSEVERAITELLNKRLLELNMRADSVRIEDISYSSAYEQAIERKQIAQQEALAEKNKTELVKQQAEQELVKTRAEAEALKIRAKAEAMAAKEKIQSLTQSKDLIEYEKVQVQRIQAEKWNGELPQAVYTGTPLPILTNNK